VALFDNGEAISDIGKHFPPFTITFIMAMGLNHPCRLVTRKNLVLEKLWPFADDSLMLCLGWDGAELRSAPTRRHNGVMCIEKGKFPASPAGDITYAVWKASLNIGT